MKVGKKASSIILAAVLTASSLYAVPVQFVQTAEAAQSKALILATKHLIRR